MAKNMQQFVLINLIENLSTPLSQSIELTELLNSVEEYDEEKEIEMFQNEDFIGTIKRFSNSIFQSHFRLERNTAYNLIREIESQNFVPHHIGGKEHVTPEKAVLLTIWYLANTETFREISIRFQISLSAAHRILRKVIKILIKLSHTFIKWPNEHEKLAISYRFAKKGGIRNVIGAIDGSHIPINKPTSDQDSYINRKGYHSLVLQGVAGPNKSFIDVYCGEPGSLHDARVLRRSELFRKAEENEFFFGKYFLLGDTAYPNNKFIVTPFKDNGHLTHHQIQFNYKVSSTRMIIENAFGLLKGRFRRLHHLYNYNVKLCTEIILASCILHNICISAGDATPIVPSSSTIPKSLCSDSEEISDDQIRHLVRRDTVFQEFVNSLP